MKAIPHINNAEQVGTFLQDQLTQMGPVPHFIIIELARTIKNLLCFILLYKFGRIFPVFLKNKKKYNNFSLKKYLHNHPNNF